MAILRNCIAILRSGIGLLRSCVGLKLIQDEVREGRTPWEEVLAPLAQLETRVRLLEWVMDEKIKEGRRMRLLEGF